MPKTELKIKIGYSNLNRSFFSRYFLLINKRHDTLNKINTWKNLEKLSLPFNDINTLVCSQGIVAYDQKEFEMDTFKKVVDLNLNSVMASCTFFHKNLSKNNKKFRSICKFWESYLPFIITAKTIEVVLEVKK